LHGRVYRISSYECDYSEESGLQKRKQEIEEAPVVPRINPRLLCEGKRFGVSSRGPFLCDNRGDLSVANPCSCRRTARILPARGDLIVEVDRVLLKTMEIAEGASSFPLTHRRC
jgi:hypothetical protein